MRKVALSIFLTCLVTFSLSAAENGPNLIMNPGFEGTAEKLVPHWEPLTMGPAATIEGDAHEKHSGSRSARIIAAEPTRAYVTSEYIPVAPGESISAGAWIKCKDVPDKKGAVIVIGEFANSKEKQPTFVKFDVAKVTDTNWQKVAGTQKVPEAATRMRLRIGFSYASGTIWIDDAEAHAAQPLVASIALDDSQLSPGDGGVPVDVINRTRMHSQHLIRIQLPGAARSQLFSLSGEGLQHVLVPLDITKRGKQKLKMELTDERGEKVIHSEEREIVVPPPVVLMPAVPTHWAVEDGAPQIEGEVQLALAKPQREGAALSVTLLDSQKRVKATWTSNQTGEIPDGISNWQLKCANLPIGDYTLVSELKPQHGQAFTSEQPWAVIPRAMAKTTINADGYPVINGKAIFPLGIFNGGKFKEQADAGYTVTHAYNAMRVAAGVHPDDQNAKHFLDETLANGMHMCCMVPLEFAYAGDWDGFRRRIRMFRNHPGLLCWDEEESLARGTTTIETIAKMRQIVQEEDPNHPFMIGDSRDAITRVTDRSNFFPLKYMDLGMWWWYPIPLEPGTTTNALEGTEATPADEMAPPSFLVQRNTDKPIWVGVQAYKHNEKSRYPNYTEYRAQPYIAMIAGAKGLMWYGGSVTDGVYIHPEEGNLKDLERVVHELNEMSAVFMSPSAATPKFSPPKAPISVMLKKTKDGPVLIAVNRGGSPVEVTFDVAQSSGSAKVAQEDRSVRVSDGKLKDNFKPYEVHVYSLLK